MHESEGSVITDIWKTSAANYNTALRKAAEHEPISRNRVKGASEIKNPKLSMLLTGTFGQYKALVPSVENGYFSRLLTVVIKGTNGFDKRYVQSKGGQSAVPKIVGQRLLRTYEALMESGEREWSLTDSQKERLGEHLETEYGTLIGLLGENFHSAVIRMAVQIERIAMVLSAMRGDFALSREAGNELKPELNSDSMNETLLCSDVDYETAEVIGSKMLMHMAMAYRMIKGDEQETMPEVKGLDQRKVVFELLKPVYDNHELESEGKRQGVSRATIFRWNEKWLAEGLIIRSHRGKYQKVA